MKKGIKLRKVIVTLREIKLQLKPINIFNKI